MKLFLLICFCFCSGLLAAQGNIDEFFTAAQREYLFSTGLHPEAHNKYKVALATPSVKKKLGKIGEGNDTAYIIYLDHPQSYVDDEGSLSVVFFPATNIIYYHYADPFLNRTFLYKKISADSTWKVWVGSSETGSGTINLINGKHIRECFPEGMMPDPFCKGKNILILHRVPDVIVRLRYTKDYRVFEQTSFTNTIELTVDSVIYSDNKSKADSLYDHMYDANKLKVSISKNELRKMRSLKREFVYVALSFCYNNITPKFLNYYPEEINVLSHIYGSACAPTQNTRLQGEREW